MLTPSLCVPLLCSGHIFYSCYRALLLGFGVLAETAVVVLLLHGRAVSDYMIGSDRTVRSGCKNDSALEQGITIFGRVRVGSD